MILLTQTTLGEFVLFADDTNIFCYWKRQKKVHILKQI